MSDESKRIAMNWIVGDDTGMSSQTIWSVMMGVPSNNPSVPYDADDFGRCWRLVAQTGWRPRLPEVAARYPLWVGIIREWDRLSELYKRVVAGPNGWSEAASREFSDALEPLIDEGRIADGWERIGPRSWNKPKAAKATGATP